MASKKGSNSRLESGSDETTAQGPGDIRSFLVNLATDAAALGGFIKDPDASMTAAGIAPEDQLILKSGNAAAIYAKLQGGATMSSAPAAVLLVVDIASSGDDGRETVSLRMGQPEASGLQAQSLIPQLAIQVSPQLVVQPQIHPNVVVHPQLVVHPQVVHPQILPQLVVHPQVVHPQLVVHPQILPQLVVHPQVVHPQLVVHPQILPQLVVHPQVVHPQFVVHPQILPQLVVHPQVIHPQLVIQPPNQ